MSTLNYFLWWWNSSNQPGAKEPPLEQAGGTVQLKPLATHNGEEGMTLGGHHLFNYVRLVCFKS